MSLTNTLPFEIDTAAAALASESVEIRSSLPIWRTAGGFCAVAAPVAASDERHRDDGGPVLHARSHIDSPDGVSCTSALIMGVPTAASPAALLTRRAGRRRKHRSRESRRSRTHSRQIATVEMRRGERGQFPMLCGRQKRVDRWSNLHDEINRRLARSTVAIVRRTLIVPLGQRAITSHDRRPDRVEADEVPPVQRRDAIRLRSREAERIRRTQNDGHGIEKPGRAV